MPANNQITAKKNGSKGNEKHQNNEFQQTNKSLLLNASQGTSTSQERNMKAILAEKKRKESQRERTRKYRERQKKIMNTNISQVQKLQKIVDRKKTEEQCSAQRQLSLLTKNQRAPRVFLTSAINKDNRRRELGRERQRRLRRRQRENLINQQEKRQRICEQQNLTVSQVQDAQNFEEVKMEFFEETAVDPLIETNTIYVKQEFRNEIPSTIPNNTAVSTNTECEPSVIELIDETSSLVENDIKQEITDVPSSLTTEQDFVFVACADVTPLNEATIRDSRTQCPYCGKVVVQLNLHKLSCDGRFVYFCTLCPMVLKRQCNIKRHVETKHALNSVDEVIKEIVGKRKELSNINTAEEKVKAIQELKKAYNVTKVNVHKEVYIVTKNQQELIVPDLIETRQESTTNTQTSNVPFVMIKKVFEMPPSTLIQKNRVCNATTTKELNLHAETMNQEVIVANSSQKSSHPCVVDRINDPTVINMQNPAVTTEKPKGKAKKPDYVYCNECVYKTPRKICLMMHIAIHHGDKLNIKQYKCPRCRKIFQYKEHFKAHKALCNCKAPFYCPFCPETMLYKNWMTHILTKHSKEIENKTTDEMKKLLVVAKKGTVWSSIFGNQKSVTRSKYLSGHDNSNLVGKVVGTDSVNLNIQSQSSHCKNANVKQPDYIYCNECVYKSTKKRCLMKHIITHHSDKLNLKRYTCTKCEASFQYQKHFKTHKATCKEKIYYYCPFCPKYLLFGNMLKHVMSQHPKEVGNKKSDEIKNLLMATKKAIESSTVINKKAANFIKKPNVPCQCDHCSYKTLNKDHLIRHINRNHSGKSQRPKLFKPEYFCDHCNYKTLRKYHLIRHINTHSPKLKKNNRKTRSVGLKKLNNKSQSPKPIKEIDQKAQHVRFIKRWKYTCLFCPISYARLRNAKEHILEKHSSELTETTIEEVAKEINSKRTKFTIFIQPSKTSKRANFKQPEVDPYQIDSSKFEYILVYCYKCKHVKTSSSKRGYRMKQCPDCGAQMIYLCSKCKEMHSVQSESVAQHWKKCTQVNEISHHLLDKVKLYSCSECSFLCTHKFKFASHIARSKHKPADMENAKEDKGDQNVDEHLEMYDEAKFAIRPCVTDYATMTERYCSKCDKVITEEMQERKHLSVNENCQVCGTQFLLRCIKCTIGYKSYVSLRYHLNSRCFPGDYKCVKCGKRVNNWNAMQKHYLNSHTNKKEAFLCEFCSFRSKHRTNFYLHMQTMHSEQSKNIVPDNIQLKKREIDYFCDNCDFVSKRKGSLKVHLQNVHGKKRHKCTMCKFKTRYEASLRRHISTRHKNYY